MRLDVTITAENLNPNEFLPGAEFAFGNLPSERVLLGTVVKKPPPVRLTYEMTASFRQEGTGLLCRLRTAGLSESKMIALPATYPPRCGGLICPLDVQSGGSITVLMGGRKLENRRSERDDNTDRIGVTSSWRRRLRGVDASAIALHLRGNQRSGSDACSRLRIRLIPDGRTVR
jgi:hypothetical protein